MDVPLEPQKSWFSRHMVLGYVFLAVIFLGIVAGIYYVKYGFHKPGQQSAYSEVKSPAAETSDWKTYSNTQTGFEFKYPSDWVLGGYHFGQASEVAVDPVRVASQADMETLDIAPGLVSVHTETCATPSGCHVIGYENLKQVNIGINSAVEARTNTVSFQTDSPNPSYLGKHEISYFVDYGQNKAQRAEIRYVSDLSDKNLTDFNQILASFKFASEQTDISTWTIYTNDQYGFQIKIPKDWSIELSEGVIKFISAEARAYNEQNAKACLGLSPENSCSPENPGADIIFSQNANATAGPKTDVTFSDLTFKRYESDGLYGEMNYMITKKGKIYNFAVFNNQLGSQILSTFQFTK